MESGNTKPFWINKKFILVKQLTSALIKWQNSVRQIAAAWVNKVIFFGSRIFLDKQ